MSHLREFTNEIITNRNLIIEMLKYEDLVIHGDIGKKIYNDNSYEHYTTHEAMYTIHRIVLSEFGFNFDALSISMLIPISLISCLVQFYSASYLNNDPHIVRFFNYLNFFSLFMII